jgi:hypothetical protein
MRLYIFVGKLSYIPHSVISVSVEMKPLVHCSPCHWSKADHSTPCQHLTNLSLLFIHCRRGAPFDDSLPPPPCPPLEDLDYNCFSRVRTESHPIGRWAVESHERWLEHDLTQRFVQQTTRSNHFAYSKHDKRFCPAHFFLLRSGAESFGHVCFPQMPFHFAETEPIPATNASAPSRCPKKAKTGKPFAMLPAR